LDQLVFLDAAFFVFHTAWIAFNCLGWIWRRTRPWQLLTVSLTALSWVGLGLFYGWGYCPCTDWHWQVRARLGYVDPPSYIQLLVAQLTGVQLGTIEANTLAVVTLAIAGVLGVIFASADRLHAPRDPDPARPDAPTRTHDRR
jgi:hypothetical protein